MSLIQMAVTARNPEGYNGNKSLASISASVEVLEGKTPRRYTLFVTATYVTVCAIIFNRRTMGKTYHNSDKYQNPESSLTTAYKRDGAKLVEIIAELRKEIAK